MLWVVEGEEELASLRAGSHRWALAWTATEGRADTLHTTWLMMKASQNSGTGSAMIREQR